MQLHEGSPPESTSLQLFERQFDSCDTVWVPTGETVERLYCGLAPSQWEEIETACIECDQTDAWQRATKNVLKQFRDWKYDPISLRASRHECLFADIFDDNTAPIRGFKNDEEGREELQEAVTAEQRQVAQKLRDLSVSLATDYDLFSCRAYRGLGYHLSPIAEAIFTDPNRSHVRTESEFSVLTNVTLDRAVASQFSEIILEIDLSADLVASVPDFLTHTVVYYHDDAEWRPVPEAEIRVRGDALTQISPDQLTIAGQTDSSRLFSETVAQIPTSIKDYDVSGPPLFTQEEHLAIREAALSFADYDYTDSGDIHDVNVNPPTATAALDRLSVWLDIFDAESEPGAPDGPSKAEVQMIVEKIIDEGRT